MVFRKYRCQHFSGLDVHLVCNLDGPREDLLDVVQPVGRLQVAQPAVVLDVGETHVLHLEQSKGEDYQKVKTRTLSYSFLFHAVFITYGAADDPSVSQSIFIVTLLLVESAYYHKVRAV